MGGDSKSFGEIEKWDLATLQEYEMFQGTHAICMAYRKDTWQLLVKGETDVAEDMRTEYYGMRGTQWMRLQHKAGVKHGDTMWNLKPDMDFQMVAAQPATLTDYTDRPKTLTHEAFLLGIDVCQYLQ